MSGSSSWKVAYADFVTAMMAFFLLMWILNAAPEETKAGLGEYFTEGGTIGASSVGSTPGLTLPVAVVPDELFAPSESSDSNPDMAAISQMHEEVAADLVRFLLDKGITAEGNGISDSANGVLMTLTSDVMFEPGSVNLTPMGQQSLDEVAAILNKHVISLITRGHTSTDETGEPYPSKWDLAAARATACLRYIQEHTVAPSSYLRAVSYADTHPKYPDTNASTSQHNRRVEFFFFSPQLVSTFREF